MQLIYLLIKSNQMKMCLIAKFIKIQHMKIISNKKAKETI